MSVSKRKEKKLEEEWCIFQGGEKKLFHLQDCDVSSKRI